MTVKYRLYATSFFMSLPLGDRPKKRTSQATTDKGKLFVTKSLKAITAIESISRLVRSIPIGKYKRGLVSLEKPL